ncbi:MAG: hypothetical protein ACF8GE_04605 [Phycisphaerales bacterium JB043]
MKTHTHTPLYATAMVVLTAMTITIAYASPLTPPPGPITATGPLQISQQSIGTFPFTITEPGSYIFAGNVTNSATADGIIVDSDNVFIDLNGFTLSGEGVSSETGRYGIQVEANRSNVRVVNGTISGWEGMSNAGLRGFGAGTLLIENVSLVGNRNGVVSDMRMVVRDCVGVSNTDSGFITNTDAIFYNCVANSNTSAGFKSGSRVTYINCHTGNNAFGFWITNGDAIVGRCSSSGDSTPYRADGGSNFLPLDGADTQSQ